ncbi:Cyclin-dependent kinase 2-interacting protein [Larimichthys crocea]|uniref:Cyclin-dependent kinase 2-interacting protein n=1 Tax=Larimichthys crocea TaxID=215358 RepID=A0A0F8ALF5_LARCR|nr:cyclin-dependent kinase 2-interacting protein [Larimichthys crocea]KAE8290420.1 Cyclin-dependent kinase 2-interacting protein [Larimichthys crocea]TMS01684.1 Cyclin-dependent kinase 2-interacting protein [Larimichthys crocea]
MEAQSSDVTVTSAKRKCSAVTGSARKIKDNAADWHNLLLRWEHLNETGFNVARNIVNIRQTHSQSDQLLLVDESPSSAPSRQTGGANELQDECCKLQDIVDKMVVVVMKMERLMTSQQGVQDLEEFQFGHEGRRSPLFHSWNTKHFEAASRVLLESFSQELKLRQSILQQLAHTVNSDLCMVYLSCWLHQPFTPPQTRLTLEALLLETGHRPL